MADRVQTGKGDAHTRVDPKKYREADYWKCVEEKKGRGQAKDK